MVTDLLKENSVHFQAVDTKINLKTSLVDIIYPINPPVRYKKSNVFTFFGYK